MRQFHNPVDWDDYQSLPEEEKDKIPDYIRRNFECSREEWERREQERELRHEHEFLKKRGLL